MTLTQVLTQLAEATVTRAAAFKNTDIPDT